MNLACQADAARAGDAVLIVPAFVKELTEAQHRRQTDKAPNLTVGQWLRAQPANVQRRERLRVLRKLGLVSL
jgi:hypothetical protein